MQEPRKKYHTAADWCRRFQISATTLWRWQRAGAIPAPLYTPGGQRRWPAEDVERWEREHLQAKAALP